MRHFIIARRATLIAVLFFAAGHVTQVQAQSTPPIFNWQNVNQPAWSFYAGGLYLQRSRPSSARVIGTPTPSTTLIDAHSYDFDWQGTPEFVLQRRFDNGWMLEGRYFGNISSSASSNIASITSFRAAGIGVTILGGGSLDTSYETDLKNAEFNVHKQVMPGFSLLAGFRWIELRDKLHVNIASPATFIDWDSKNRMYGGQVGFNLALFSPGLPLRFDLTGKAGWFNNSMNNRMDSTIVSVDQSSKSQGSFAGELNFSGTYQLNEHLALKAGYMLLYLDRVALASEAAANTTQAPGGTSSPVSTGSVWYQGVIFGATLSF